MPGQDRSRADAARLANSKSSRPWKPMAASRLAGGALWHRCDRRNDRAAMIPRHAGPRMRPPPMPDRLLK
jgi:hypothetical protein